MTEVVEAGDTIKVHYTGTFPDGTKFDSSEGKEPLELTAGEGKVIKGFDAALVGMKKGEKKSVTIPPEEAYGPQNPQMVIPVPKDKLPAEQEPKKGMILGMNAPDGRQMMAKIDRIEGDKVFLDLNHPLAGKTLKFDLEVVEVTKKK
tara:strand:- start:120 stop:560 length:441 start_codon:yes stop_codon:yes gene_type:complete